MRRNLRNVALVVCVLIVLLIVNHPHATYQPRVIPMQTYTYYIPFLTKPRGLYGAGIASISGGKYNKLLNADWHYVWGWCDAPCISMTRDWTVPRACPPILLVGNEPNSQEPYGFPIEPGQAAIESRLIRARCPGTWLIVGNLALPEFLGITGIEWWTRYVAAGGEYDQAGIHCYVSPNGNVNQCVQALTDFANAFPSIRLCLTEFNSFNRKIEIFTELLNWVVTHFDCYAAFTDYDPAPFYGANLNMVTGDGTPNEYGKIFRNHVREWLR